MQIKKIKKILTVALMAVSLISIAPTYNAFAAEDQAIALQLEQDKAFIETCTLAPNDMFGNNSTYEKNGKYYSYTDGLIQKNTMTGKNYAKEDGTLARNEWVYITYKTDDLLNGGTKWVSTWRYYGDDFKCLKKLQTINGKKYFFNGNGDLRIGWFLAKAISGDGRSSWYYSQPDGSIEAGWVQSGSDWYYVNSDGEMLKNTTVDGYTLDKKGRWVK